MYSWVEANPNISAENTNKGAKNNSAQLLRNTVQYSLLKDWCNFSTMKMNGEFTSEFLGC